MVGMTGALPVAIVLGNGAAVPGAYLAAGIVLLLFSVGYATMSQRVTNTGAFFAYVGRGLGIGPGVGGAYTSLVAYLAVQLAIYGFFGAVVSRTDERQARHRPDVVGLVADRLGSRARRSRLFSVDVGAKVLGVLMLARDRLARAGGAGRDLPGRRPGRLRLRRLLRVRTTSSSVASTGSAGIALAFAFASFIGFEATAIYGEESKDPKRTVPIATYLAVILITVLFAVTTFAVITRAGRRPGGRRDRRRARRSTASRSPTPQRCSSRWPTSTSAAGCPT